MSAPRFIAFLFLFCTCLQQTPDAQAQTSKENADFKLALNLYNDGLFDLAAEQLKQFINNFPGTPNGIEARFYLGLTQLKLSQFDDARLTFQTFALTYQDNPKAPDAWMHVGDCYVALRNYKEAALAFERVKVFHPHSNLAPEALIKASRYFSRADQSEDARRVLRIVLQEYANSNAALSARTMLGQMYFEEGNLAQAQNELKRVIEGDPSPDAKAQALLILGNIYKATGELPQAQATYQDIIKEYKNTSAAQGAYLNLGIVLASAGKCTDAIENYKKVFAGKTLQDSTTIFEANTGIGDCYAETGDISNALTYYDRAAAHAPSQEEAFATTWKVAIAAARGKSWPRSNDACKRILKSVAPADLKQKATIRLALNAEARKDYGQAIQYLSSFLDQFAANPFADEVAFRMAGLAQNELHDARKAGSMYEQFIIHYSHSPYIDDAYAGAARCYEALKEFDRAAQLYRELLDKYPSSDLRQSAEDRIRTIDTFEAKEKDAGVEKLALLLGDVVSDKDKIGLSYRLGEIYFKDLKNYSAAVVQFTNAINSGMNDSRFIDALYYRARALEFLSWNDRKYVPQAIESYQTFLKSYPDDPRSEQAALSVFMLSASSLQNAYSAYEATLGAFPKFQRRDTMLERIGELQEKADSTQVALSTYGDIIRDFSNSPTIPEVAFRRIPLLLSLGLTDSAMHEAESYLGAYPNGPHSAEVAARLAELLEKNGKAAQAADYYRTLAEDFYYASFAKDAPFHLADAYTTSGKYNQAIEVYSELIQAQQGDPLREQGVDPALLVAMGRAYQGAGNIKEAKAYLFQALARQQAGEEAGQAYSILGQIAKSEGNLDLATSYFRQSGNAQPNTASSRDVANLLFSNGAYADAIRQYRLLSQSATTDTERQYCDAHVILAQYKNDDPAGADRGRVEFLKKYGDDQIDVAAFDLEKGLYYYRKEDYPNARKAFDHIIDKYDDTPSAPFAMYWIGKMLEIAKKQQDALKLYDDLMKRYAESPVVPKVHLALGNIYYDQEKWDESIRNYRTIVDDSAADPGLLAAAMSNLIETYEAAGIFDAALQLTRRYLEAFPNNEDVLDKKIKIGILYQELGYNDQSVLQLQSLLDQAGSDLEGEIRYYIAEANYNKGDYQQAILDFLKVPYLVTKKGKLDWTANSLYMAGQSYEKLGRFDQALTMYQQIVERSGIDETFKAAAKKEIDRVKLVLKKGGSK